MFHESLSNLIRHLVAALHNFAEPVEDDSILGPQAFWLPHKNKILEVPFEPKRVLLWLESNLESRPPRLPNTLPKEYENVWSLEKASGEWQWKGGILSFSPVRGLATIRSVGGQGAWIIVVPKL